MTTAPTPDLLPCPFCGGPASAHEVNPKEAPGWVHLTVEHAPDCFYRVPKETLLLSAFDLERWNRRAELEARKPLPLSDEQLRAEFIPWAEIQYRHEDEFSKRDFKICLAAWSAGHRAALVDKSPNLQEPLVDKNANLQDRPAPLSDEQIDDLHGEANRGFDIGREEYFKAFRDAERAHGIKET